MSSALSLDSPPDRNAFDAQWQAVLTSPSSICLLAVANGSIGYAIGVVAPMPVYGGGLAFLQELYVDVAHRRSGAGRRLVDAFTAWSGGCGAVRVALATSRAGAFYEALGFTTRPALYYARAVD